MFVKEALLSITRGVEEANSGDNRFRIIGVKRNASEDDGNEVEFDVSIGTEQVHNTKTGGESKIGISVLNVLDVASVNSSSNEEATASRQNVNRLKFKVWISEKILE